MIFKKQKIMLVMLLTVLLVVFCGCKQEPTTNSVISKNDGSFDSGVLQPAPQNQASENISLHNEFTSTDKSVTFSMNIEKEWPQNGSPVVEVTPHYLTADDAKRVANILLGDATFYEKEPVQDLRYSKEQIQEKISRWSQYTSTQALSDLYGDQADSQTLEIVKEFINEYTLMLDTAQNYQPKLCEWTLKKDAYYVDPLEELEGVDLSNNNDEIQAIAQVGSVEYTLDIATRNKNDFKLNNIYLYLSSGSSPRSIDTRIFYSRLCRTEKPSELDVQNVKAKAQNMLDQMDLGQWQVDNSRVETTYYGDVPEYVIHVSAVPVFHKTPAIRRPQLGNLKSDTSYASNYYLTDANFKFSANGDILAFSMFSPVDEKEVLNTNVQTKNGGDLIELAENHLILSDYYDYSMSPDFLDVFQESVGENVTCKVDICQLEYGLIRVKVPNTDESYYYVPGMILYGTIDYWGEASGNILASSGDPILSNSRIVPLVALNAVDGSFIELSNE